MIILCDIDGTLCSGEPYYRLTKIADDIEVQHKVAQTNGFRRILLTLEPLQWVKLYKSIMMKAKKVIYNTGRNEYNKDVTLKWLRKNGLLFPNSDVVFLNFQNFEEYFKKKIQLVKDTLKTTNDLIVFIDDNREIVERVKGLKQINKITRLQVFIVNEFEELEAVN